MTTIELMRRRRTDRGAAECRLRVPRDAPQGRPLASPRRPATRARPSSDEDDPAAGLNLLATSPRRHLALHSSEGQIPRYPAREPESKLLASRTA